MGKPTRLQKERARRRQRINERYAARHPEKARGERALRVGRHLTEKNWHHKNEGTPETHEKASRQRQGALARLFASGALSADQLAWAQEIAGVHERIAADVTVRTVSLETRIDGGATTGIFWESLAVVRREIAYTSWRAAIVWTGARPAAMVLAVIVGDTGVTIAARRHGMGVKRAKKQLSDALDLWPELLADARREVDAAGLAAMQAGLI